MINLIKFVFLLSFLCHIVKVTDGAKKKRESKKELQYSGMDSVLKYLTAFGYLDDMDVEPNHMSLYDISDSIKDFQEMMGLNESGLLDKETLRIMNSPRCSNKDKVRHHHHSPTFQKLYFRNENTNLPPEKFEKYTLYGTKWEKDVVTYRIIRYSFQSLSHDVIDRQIRAAFQAWERHINLRFLQSQKSEVDIEIHFTRGAHGDNFPFSYGTSQLAHAFYPGTGLGGDVHFNDEVKWTEGNVLFYAALHEIGHSLGLRHSSDQNSIMFSHLIQDKNNEISLHSDDIAGIQAIYGARYAIESTTQKIPLQQPPPRTTNHNHNHNHNHDSPRQNPLERHQICQDGKFDAVTSFSNGNILFFRGEEIITLEDVGGVFIAKKPNLIRNVFSSRLPSNLDAVFTTENNKTYFLKGNLYWRTSGFFMDEGYPKLIGRNFPGVPDNVNAAFAGSANHIYFFKGSTFWKFNISNKRVSKFDIKRHWKGIPYDGIEAVYRNANGNVFFFREGRYWKFLHSQNSVSQIGDYPRDNRLWWFACTNFNPHIHKL